MSLFAARGFAGRGVPVLLDVNEIPDPFERQGAHFVAADSAVKRRLARAFARDLPAAARIIATSASMADFVAERFGRGATAIRNARPPLSAPPSAAIRADVGATAATRILVYPCTAAPHLGVEAAIETLARLPENFSLVFVGRFVTPAYRETIERLIRRLGLTRRVVLKGELPDSDYLPYLAGADIGLVPLSFAYRNQRLVLPWRLIDLATAGVPMVATASDEVRRLARDYDIGEIAADAAPEAIAASVLRLAAAPATRRAGIVRDLTAMAARFSPAHEAARYRAEIAALAGERPGRAAFVANLALRHNRRLIGFIDAACALGWRVDLYCVRAPDRALFAMPDRVRAVALSDRLAPAWLQRAWRATRRARLTPPGMAAPIAALVAVCDGAWSGMTQLRRVRRFARAVRRETARQGPWDIVIATDLFALPAGLAARGGGALVYDATEIPDLRQRTARFLRRIPAPLRLPFRWWERAYVRRAALVLAPSHALTRYLRRRYRGRATAPVVAVRNAASLTRDNVLDEAVAPTLRARLGIPDSDIVLVSPGGISAETGALVAAGTLRHLPPDHVLVFIGRFSNPRIEPVLRAALARDRVAHRCFFVGEIPYPAYLRDLAACDLGLVLFDPAIANMRLAAPNRVFDLIAMGVPMVATEIEEVAGLLRRTGIGAVARQRRPAAVARAARDLADRFGIAQGGAIGRRARLRLDRVSRLYRGETEMARLVAALTAQAGPVAGKRIALMTLRSAASNRRFLRIGAALAAAGARIAAFDTDIGAPAATPWADRPPWLITFPIR
ncbi:MAG TPA: glycosyltransferase [Stellaceae bacterium]